MKDDMERELVGKRPTFRPAKPGLNVYRLTLWVCLILAGVYVLLGFQQGQFISPYQATPTPTRTASSYILEAEAYFQAGKLYSAQASPPAPANYDAINTYQRALKINPNDGQAWANLARIQTYSTSMLSSDQDRLKRLQEALDSINQAVKLAPEDSTVHAIRAFVLDWYASNGLQTSENRQQYLGEAQNEALIAYQYDHTNALALAFYAEVLLDQQNWTQAEQYAAQAVALGPNLMDTHRVYGTVLESLGQYNSAIKEYIKASAINPNLTFLYVYIGRNYLSLRLYDRALEYFARAANINSQLGVHDPQPNIEIAKTYAQQGEFLIAALNAEKAVSYDPTNANTYGQLGIIYIRARNYEGAMPALKCAVRGCTATENEVATNLTDQGLLPNSVAVQPMEMSNISVAYYYVEYGTVLAFLSTSTQNYCTEARQVLEEVRSGYGSDTIIASIINDSESICTQLEQPTPVISVTPSPTPGPTTVSATPTPGG